MTPRAGGEAAKLGGHYEAAWTVRMALEVLHGRAEAIVLEPDPPLGVGVEFILERAERMEAHQVKRQIGLRNSWTVRALEQEGVLETARLHVQDGREFHFVSIVPSRPLHELTERARRSDDASHLAGRLTEELASDFCDLQDDRIWQNEDTAYRILRKLFLHWTQPDELQSTNAMLAKIALDGAPSDALASVLADVLTSQTGRRLDADALVTAAEAQGLRGRDIRRGRPSVVSKATASWLDAARATLLKPRIARLESAQLTQLLTAGEHTLVAAMGAAGAGKTAVLADVVENLTEQHWLVLALRLDERPEAATTDELGQRLPRPLPGSPVEVLGKHAGFRPCLLVVDQLDAVSFVAGRGGRLFDVIRELLREASAFPAMRVLLACRQFDWDNDERFRELAVAGHRPKQFLIPELGPEQVDHALLTMGLEAHRLTHEQRALLANPFRLVLLERIREARANGSDANDPLDFTTEEDLLVVGPVSCLSHAASTLPVHVHANGRAVRL